MNEPNWGPTGKAVFERTYSRKKADGTKETWEDTVRRVVDGNTSLVPAENLEQDEAERLYDLIYSHKLLPAGRHLWMSGVPGRQFLFNCHHAGWDPQDVTRHFVFTFDQLMQGGGVGSNYSTQYVKQYGPVHTYVDVHVVCDPDHPNYDELERLGVLSASYTHEWTGTIEVEDSREGWYDALAAVLTTAYEEGSPSATLVFDVSHIRKRGSLIKTFGGTASGPAPFAVMMHEVTTVLNSRVGYPLRSLDAMDIDHAIASCVVSGNVRRSARMAIKHWSDHDIFEFIACKRNPEKHWSTNISVEVDDDFFLALRGEAYPLDRADRAQRVLRAIVAGMLQNGEPGIYNRSLAQLGEVGEVSSTNPCGEIALEQWENCNLGHINLDAFVTREGAVDHKGLQEAHRLMARFLIRATFGDVPDPRQRAVLDRNRRIGVGHFGFQGFAVKRGIRYSDTPHSNIPAELLRMREVVRATARRYAFELRIPEPIKVTTVAPTGTVAKLAGRTEGIHPLYSRYFIRRVRYAADDPAVLEFFRQGYNVVEDIYAPNTMVVEFVTKDTLVDEVAAMGHDPDALVESVDEIPLVDLLAVQEMYQSYYADNAVSFTANVPEGKYDVDEVCDLLAEFLPYLKGTTLMPDGTRPLAPYERLTRAEYEAAQVKGVDDSYDETCASGACPVK